jgi:formylglycine-generating enzyme required for sulfatase activity
VEAGKGATVQPKGGLHIGDHVFGCVVKQRARQATLGTGWLIVGGLLTIVLSSCHPSPPPPGMVLIPAGPFLMGTDDVDTDQEALSVGFPHPWYEDEHPLRTIDLPAFYIGQYEVTNDDYQEFVTAGYRAPPDWVKGAFPQGRAAFPVVYVSWYEAMDYCHWRQMRLPTEAEWEKAARGPKGLKYPWGETFDPARANIATGPSLAGSTRAVGQYDAGKSPYGVYDMIGNVWEWTDSWYQPYSGNRAVNENFGTTYRVNRGLSFMSIGHIPADQALQVESIIARASFRSYDYPSSHVADVGFRCAKSLK